MTDAEIAKMAAMEAELAGLRARAPQAPPFDFAAFRRSIVMDPNGTLTKIGLPPEHVAHVGNTLAADLLGDKAPPQLRAAAMMGPTVAAQGEILQSVNQLRQQVHQLTEEKTRDARMTAARMAGEKNPHVARALAADPSLLEQVVAAGGTPEDVAARLDRMAKAFAPQPPGSAPPASTDAGSQQAQGTQQAKAVQAGAARLGDPPPLSDRTPGAGFTDSMRDELKAKIQAKFDRGEYGSPG